jgi:hypothetical protein
MMPSITEGSVLSDKAQKTILLKHAKRLVSRVTSPLRLSKLTETCVMLMQLSNQVECLSGSDKKRLVVTTMLLAAQEVCDDDGLLETIILATIPELIEWLIVADRRQLTLNPLVVQMAKASTWCCSAKEPVPPTQTPIVFNPPADQATSGSAASDETHLLHLVDLADGYLHEVN